jgi:hypothetical protein
MEHTTDTNRSFVCSIFMVEVIHIPAVFWYLSLHISFLDDIFPKLRGAGSPWYPTSHANNDSRVILRPLADVVGGSHSFAAAEENC